jgi:competence protein ComGC
MKDKYSKSDPVYILIGVMVVIAIIAVVLILSGII